MKTIIVPTDYSANAHNATIYAAQLAKAAKAKISLLHVFHLPGFIDAAAVPFSSLQEFSNEHKVHLETIAREVAAKYEIEVDSHVYPGFITEILPDFVHKQNGDLVVMGMRGMGKVEKILLGSVTTNILRKADFPLLIVPSKATFSPIKHILLACDYHADAVNAKLSILKESALVFNAEVRVLHIGQPEAEMAEVAERVETGRKLERMLKGVLHSFTHIKEEDVVEGIYSSLKMNQTDLLVMVPRKRNFWKGLTSRSNTQRIALNIDLPLLAIPQTTED